MYSSRDVELTYDHLNHRLAARKARDPMKPVFYQCIVNLDKTRRGFKDANKGTCFGIVSMRLSQKYREGCEHRVSPMRAFNGKSERVRL
jgi:hypothetical protein